MVVVMMIMIVVKIMLMMILFIGTANLLMVLFSPIKKIKKMERAYGCQFDMHV